MNDPLLFILSLVFLLGVVVVSLSVFPAFRARFPQGLLIGFALSAGAIIAVFALALLRA